MICDVCKTNEASVFLTQIVDGKMQKVNLCDSCSKEKGVDDPTGFSLADLLLGLGAAQQMEQASGGIEVKCPHCGFIHADFKKAGRLGCAECYKVFSEGFETLLKTMHKGTRHVGKVPQVFRQNQDLTDKLKGLQKKLEKAIADEDFESAAKLRDELKAIRAQMTEMTV